MPELTITLGIRRNIFSRKDKLLGTNCIRPACREIAILAHNISATLKKLQELYLNNFIFQIGEISEHQQQ